MRIGIDARFFGSRSKGLGRYTQELVEHILRIDAENEYILFMHSSAAREWKNDFSQARVVEADFRWYSVAEQTRLPRVLANEHCDVYHFPHFNVPLFFSEPFVVTIHDLILSHFPTIRATTLGPMAYKIKHFMYTRVILHALRASKHIITISEFTKNDLLKTYHLSPDKLTVTYEGVGESITPHTREENRFQVNGIRSPFLLYIGNAYPHKNLETLVDAFCEIKRKNPMLQLVLVGKMDYFFKRLQTYVHEKQARDVVFTGYATDDQLRWLYHHASVYVFPSLYEGFGLPPLEAMAHGLPVASSNASCMPEILQDAAAYFNPKDLHDMIHTIQVLLESDDQRMLLRDRGNALIKRYSWQTMAEQTLRVYNNAYERSK